MDPDLVIDEEIKKRLLDGGMDDLLATHFAHLFIRDPIVIFAEDLEELDLNKTDHFENLQSTNWQHIRFKPPPADNDIGWRVEFRPMEVQLTDLENAAFSVFMVLITRAILSFDLNFYIPIPRTTENMETAHARNAVLDKKFYFRKDPFQHRFARSNQRSKYADHSNSSAYDSETSSHSSAPTLPPVESEYELMSIAEIINGSATDGFPGLIPLVESYLNSVNVDVETRCALAKYLELIRRRADGTLWTNAKWIREYVDKHPQYTHDSVVSEKICFDMIKAVQEVTEKEGADESIGWEMFQTRKRQRKS